LSPWWRRVICVPVQEVQKVIELSRFLLNCVQFARDNGMPNFDTSLAFQAAFLLAPMSRGDLRANDAEKAQDPG
jgi:hypothetical protein